MFLDENLDLPFDEGPLINIKEIFNENMVRFIIRYCDLLFAIRIDRAQIFSIENFNLESN